MWNNHFLRCWWAKATTILRVQFFRPVILFFNLVLPIFWGLQFYFQYLPFGAREITDTFFNSTIQIPLVGYTLTGQFVWILFINASIYGGIFFLYERETQTLETLLMSPASRTAVKLGAATAGLLNFFWFLILSGVLMVLLQVPFVINDLFACILSLGVIITAMIATGLFFQGLFIGSRVGTSLATAMQEPMMFLSGLSFPTSYLPKILIIFALSLPLSYGLFIFRGTILAGLVLGDIIAPLVLIFILTIVLLILSVQINNMIESKIKKDATTTLF
ncbi:MAG: ABC transporter permease [Candidatus Hermodarchaeota archaeon]